MRADRLLDIVRAYDALGIHRTGTDVDHATARWLADELRSAGASDVVIEQHAFQRWDASLDVLDAEGGVVAAAPLWGSWLGSFECRSPRTVTVPMVSNWVAPSLRPAIDAARRDGVDALVIGTAGVDGDIRGGALVGSAPGAAGSEVRDDIVLINRPSFELDGPPVVLVAPSSLARCGEGATVRGSARLVDATLPVVTARFARPGVEGAPVVVTTPLSGWFHCAGERGTGIAVALHIASVLSSIAPVVFVASSGHELGHLGTKRYVHGSTVPSDVRAVVHLGASAAAGRHDVDAGAFVPSERRLALLTGAADQPTLARALARIGLDPVVDPPDWFGEAGEWAGTNVPMLSFTGNFDAFHTARDRVDAVTDASFLALVAEVTVDAALALLGVRTT